MRGWWCVLSPAILAVTVAVVLLLPPPEPSAEEFPIPAELEKAICRSGAEAADAAGKLSGDLSEVLREIGEADTKPLRDVSSGSPRLTKEQEDADRARAQSLAAAGEALEAARDALKTDSRQLQAFKKALGGEGQSAAVKQAFAALSPRVDAMTWPTAVPAKVKEAQDKLAAAKKLSTPAAPLHIGRLTQKQRDIDTQRSKALQAVRDRLNKDKTKLRITQLAKASEDLSKAQREVEQIRTAGPSGEAKGWAWVERSIDSITATTRGLLTLIGGLTALATAWTALLRAWLNCRRLIRELAQARAASARSTP